LPFLIVGDLVAGEKFIQVNLKQSTDYINPDKINHYYGKPENHQSRIGSGNLAASIVGKSCGNPKEKTLD